MSLTLLPIPGIPLIEPGHDLATLIGDAAAQAGIAFQDRDIVVVCQKAVSKAEGRIVHLKDIEPSSFALGIAAQTDGKDPRIIEVILRESKRIVRMDRGHLIVETGPGWVCANAGVDESNAYAPDSVILLPDDADASAQRLRQVLEGRAGCRLATIITDTFGRPWRDGLVDFALGVAGIDPMLDLRGKTDMNGRELHHTVVAHADGLAAAAGLLMTKGGGVPAVIVRGYEYEPAEASARTLIRPREMDLFR